MTRGQRRLEKLAYVNEGTNFVYHQLYGRSVINNTCSVMQKLKTEG